jgi:glucose-1-phosphate cytidylyltransferase
MKTIIFAGGLGSRMGTLTDDIPKPMIRVGNLPILLHIMRIYSKQKFNNFILALGYKHEIIKDYLINLKYYQNDISINFNNFNISNISQSNNFFDNWNVEMVYTGLSNLKGSRLYKLRDNLDDDINFLTYGDGLSNIDLNKLIQFHKSHGKILTITGVRPYGRFGEITVENNHVINFDEKPKVSNSIINGGFMIFNKKIFDYMSSKDDQDLETDLFKTLISLNELMVFEHQGQWSCMDHERDVKYLNDLFVSGKSFW